MTAEEIKELLNQHLPEVVREVIQSTTPATLLVDPSRIVELCSFLRTDKSLYFDSLSCLTALDNGPESGTMEVVYTLYSIPYDYKLNIRCEIDRNSPQIPSVNSVWRTADWHEREAFDLLGINFLNHPDLRRILLPTDWEGFPLRKDYSQQEKYHGITVKY
jgi:NADH-quinone oxidoreductase subunit C